MASQPRELRLWLWIPALTALLSVAAYGWALALPFIADDYLQITLGKQYGPPWKWGALAADPLYRCRATSLVLTWITERWAGLDPFWYNASSLLVHIVNTWLVFCLGAWKRIGWKVSAAAACFFAIYQGQQEAVVWYSALPELLVFFFVVSSVLFWILRYERPAHGRLWYAASMGSFLLALVSKESAVAAVGLLAIVELRESSDWRRAARYLAPCAALALLYFAADYSGRNHNQHYGDGTFSLWAPFWATLPRSLGRMLWVWGGVSLVALWMWQARSRVHLVATAACWMVVALMPYSFLTYMPVVPSRHTYLAGAGLGLIVAAGYVTLREQAGQRRVLAAITLLIFAHQCSYLWIRKQRQYIERAEPTELLVRNLRDRQGLVDVYCFPYAAEAADLAVSMRIGSGVQLRVAGMGLPAAPGPGAVNLCGTALARAAMR
ncbi:MAG: hypothetical protein ABI759_32565 [Candidatus Solibacter sp.]